MTVEKIPIHFPVSQFVEEFLVCTPQSQVQGFSPITNYNGVRDILKSCYHTYGNTDKALMITFTFSFPAECDIIRQKK